MSQEKLIVPAADMAPQAAPVEQPPTGLLAQTYHEAGKTGDTLQGTSEVCTVGAFAASSSITQAATAPMDTEDGKKRQAEEQPAAPTEAKHRKLSDSSPS